ncbi:MAG: DUF2834 domain-containing protein [Pseudomonadota bacterium]
MSTSVFERLVLTLGILFALAFMVIVVPPLVQSGDVFGAFAAGFVNPYSSGYSLDVILCALILFVWILYERKSRGIKHGWIAIPLSFVPGVATGFAVYLVLRSRQLEKEQAVV